MIWNQGAVKSEIEYAVEHRNEALCARSQPIRLYVISIPNTAQARAIRYAWEYMVIAWRRSSNGTKIRHLCEAIGEEDRAEVHKLIGHPTFTEQRAKDGRFVDESPYNEGMDIEVYEDGTRYRYMAKVDADTTNRV